jgi:hypothetical protein
MSFKKIEFYDKCEILIRQNDVEWYGFDKNKTLGEMIDLAFENECPIIQKAGPNAKWYLKGKGKSIDLIRKQIEEKCGKSRDGVICILIEYTNV